MSDKTPGGNSGEEYDVGTGWRKSSLSLSNGHCVEVGHFADGRIGVRHSKAVDGPVLRFEPEVWAAFLEDLRTSESPYPMS